MRRHVLLHAAVLCFGLGVVLLGLELLAVDRCLDSGGSFDYVSASCDAKRPHPSALVSRPLRSLLLGLCSFGLAFIAAYRMQRRLGRGGDSRSRSSAA